MVTKDDWKTEEMPGQRAQFLLERPLTEADLTALRAGHKPREMEDKWFMYCQGERLFFHRSWTGFCIYMVDFSRPGQLQVTVNRNPAQYTETSLERDRLMVQILLNRFAGRPGENAGLMKQYLALRQSEEA